MQKTISYHLFKDSLYNACKADADRYVFAENGAIYPKGPHHNMIAPEAACRAAYAFAVSHHFSGDEKLREKAVCLLDYAGRSLIRMDGYVYWPQPVAALCAMGRWARDAFHAAQLLQYKPAMEWLDELLDHWPYDRENHRFVERFVGGAHYPTSVHGFSNTYNMIAEGAADSWLIAAETGNEGLLEKAKDTLVNFILPGQREDGIWNYSAPDSANLGLLNEGEEEYNYCLYLVYILSNLLEVPDARVLLEKPVKKAMDALLERFLNEDGSIYAPVHWGWNHIFESTLLTSIVCWRLYRYCGCGEDYARISARAIHWLETANIDGYSLDGTALGSLYWQMLFLDMLKDDFSVTGDVCEAEDVIATLEGVEKKLAVLPADAVHLSFYFSLQVYATRYAIQRKVMGMKTKQPENISIPALPQSAKVSLPWQFADTCCSGAMELSHDEKGLHLHITCDGSMENQPYEGPSLFLGDGVLLSLQDETGKRATVSLAQEKGKPVVYLYNHALPFKGDLRTYVEAEPRGWYLQESRLDIQKSESGRVFDCFLAWQELGLRAEKGCLLRGGIAITRLTPYGCQYNQLGRTSLDEKDIPCPCQFILM